MQLFTYYLIHLNISHAASISSLEYHKILCHFLLEIHIYYRPTILCVFRQKPYVKCKKVIYSFLFMNYAGFSVMTTSLYK